MGTGASTSLTVATQAVTDVQIEEAFDGIPYATRQKLAVVLASLAQSENMLRCEGMKDKEEFVRFVLGATRSKATPEYQQLYTFLLSCFTEADRDFDGMVGPDDFDIMVERAGSLPRKFGFAPTSREAFPTPEARRTARAEMFKKMDKTGDMKIAFDEWMDFCYEHVCEKAKLLKLEDVQWRLGTFAAEGFTKFLKEACRSKETIEYKELYRWLLACFTDADQDRDGKVLPSEFNALIEITAEEPRRLGFAPSTSTTYSSEEEKITARRKMFDSMDTAKTGFVCFNEFMDFTYKHICEKVKSIPENPSPPAGAGEKPATNNRADEMDTKFPKNKAAFVKFVLKSTSDKSSAEFDTLYKFLLQCFTEADTDFDGMVSPDDFDLMAERAGNLPRQFGFAPTSLEAFKDPDERRAARAAMFSKMDTAGEGKIAFDKWLDFAYSHICEKAKELKPEDVQWKLGTFTADRFIVFLKKACESTRTMEYKELYHWLLRCFREADRDLDGKILYEEYDALIDKTAEEPRRLGYAPSTSTTYRSEQEKITVRKQMFDTMDTSKTGFVGFDEFLAFTYKHICEKVKAV